MEVETYVGAAFGLALMVLLAVGVAGYASIRGTFTTAAGAASDSRVEDRNREADADRIGVSAAVALGLIATLLLAVAVTPARIKIAAAPPGRDGKPQTSTPQKRGVVHYVRFEPRPPARRAMDHRACSASRRRYPIDKA